MFVLCSRLGIHETRSDQDAEHRARTHRTVTARVLSPPVIMCRRLLLLLLLASQHLFHFVSTSSGGRAMCTGSTGSTMSDHDRHSLSLHRLPLCCIEARASAPRRSRSKEDLLKEDVLREDPLSLEDLLRPPFAAWAARSHPFCSPHYYAP